MARADRKPFLIGIAGASCSGKTTLADAVACALAERVGEEVPVLGLDCYYRDLSHLPMAERVKENVDVPHALEEGLLFRQVYQMAQGECIDVPEYDYATHVRLGTTRRVCPGPMVVVEGLFTLYWEEVRAWLGMKVFVDAADGTCLARRVARDEQERGRTPEQTQAQYEAAVRPMYEQYVAPTRRFADMVAQGDAPVDANVAGVLGYWGEISLWA